MKQINIIPFSTCAVAAISILCGCATTSSPIKTLYMKNAKLIDSKVVQVVSNSAPIAYQGQAELVLDPWSQDVCLSVDVKEMVTEYVINRNEYINRDWNGTKKAFDEPGERKGTRSAKNIDVVCVASVNGKQHTTTNVTPNGDVKLPLDLILGNMIDENTELEKVDFRVTIVGDTATNTLTPVTPYDAAVPSKIPKIFSDYLINKNNKDEIGRFNYEEARNSIPGNLDIAMPLLKKGAENGHEKSAKLLKFLKYATDNIEMFSTEADFTIQRVLDGADFPSLKTSPFPFDVARVRGDVTWNLYQTHNAGGRMCILRTSKTEFTSTGRARVTVRPSSMVEVNMDNGFAQSVLVVDEVAEHNKVEMEYAERLFEGFSDYYRTKDRYFINMKIEELAFHYAIKNRNMKLLAFFNQ